MLQYILSKKFDENITKRFANAYKCANYDINKFILLLQKVVCPHINIWMIVKFNETLLSEKNCSYLNMKDITNADNKHVCKH